MIRSIYLGVLTPLAIAAMPVHAQTAAPSGQAISRAQGEQLIATLKQRNDQLRDLSAQMREMEARVAAADAATKDLENSKKALQIAAEKNRALAAIGEAIIADYEKLDLGKRIGAQEPLTQLYRVKLQNKLQEFQDQIAAQGFYPARELEMLQAASATPPANP